MGIVRMRKCKLIILLIFLGVLVLLMGGIIVLTQIGNREKTTTTEVITSKESVTAETEPVTKEPVTAETEPVTKEPVTAETEPLTKEPMTTETEEETSTGIPTDTVVSDNNKMKVTLTVPDIAMVNENFVVSVKITNCPNIEWYINGEYDATLAKKINPQGSLQFSKQGFYRITVIGYSEDWTEKVYDEVTIQVYTDPSQLNGNAKEHERAMYSWTHDFIYEENEALLQQVMEKTECNILYQELSSKADAKDVAEFLQRRGENGQQVYYLCGNANWAIEKGATSMLKEVERAVEYNKTAGEYKFVGIQFDVEPYCLLDFEENAAEYMAIYVENSKLAYQAAHEAGLLVEICIPYYWDSAYEYYDELEDLIANACDRVVVMNYYKKNKEAAHISYELELCKKYNKPIINATETIPAGQHGLTENNTYYNDGIDAIETMWNSLDGFFQYDKLGYAFHYLDIIIELLELE